MRAYGWAKPEAWQATHFAVIQILALMRIVQLGYILPPFSHLLLTLQLALSFFLRLGLVVSVVLMGVSGAQVAACARW